LELQIVDTHAHLDMLEFDTDREEVIKRAHEKGIKLINTIGIDLDSCRKAIELAERYPGIFASVGFHPQEANGVKKEDIDELIKMARHPKVVAIGEMGLDYYRQRSTPENQLKVLNWELETAQEIGKPIIIHCRQAQEEILKILRKWSENYRLPQGKPRGVIHCFNGELDAAEQYMDMGYFIALGAYIGYPSSARLRETVKSIPVERLVIETDCPFLPPQTFRGQRNEPSYTLFTLEVLAEIKQISKDEMARQTTLNAKNLFNFLG
jgi:TatD DNase family protein